LIELAFRRGSPVSRTEDPRRSGNAEDFKRCANDSRALAAKAKEALTADPHVLLQVEGDANITGAHAHSVLTTNLTTGESKATLSVSEHNAGGALAYGPAEVEAWARKSREFQSTSLEGCLQQSRDFQHTRDELKQRRQAAYAARP
jgi:hypothetical protein